MKSTVRNLVDLAVIIGLAVGSVAGLKYLKSPSTTDARASLEATRDRNRAAEELEYTGYKPEKSFQGFTLVPQAGSAKVLLVNMEGETVKQWDFDVQRIRLLDNCNLLAVHGSKWGLKREPWRSLRNKVREYTWDGELVWEYDAPNVAHHDVARLPNGNTLFIHRTLAPESTKTGVSIQEIADASIRTDTIAEVSPAGEIVWDWNYHDYFNLNYCGRWSCSEIMETIRPKKRLIDWTHTNTASPLPENRWFDQGDTRFKPGNLLIMPRNWSTLLLVDKETKKVVWKYEGSYKGGISGGHEIQMIPRGLPGAGNILIFDNGRTEETGHYGESFILELNPVTEKIEWLYESPKFFSHAAGAVQRLPNGNTLISEDVPGRVFEITKEGEIVWQYQSTIRTARAKRYDLNHCPQLASLAK